MKYIDSHSNDTAVPPEQSQPIPPFRRSAVPPFLFCFPTAYVGIQYGNLEAMPEGLRASEFITGVLKRFKTRRVNEKQKKGKNHAKEFSTNF
jgi:hypothetical protein